MQEDKFLGAQCFWYNRHAWKGSSYISDPNEFSDCQQLPFACWRKACKNICDFCDVPVSAWQLVSEALFWGNVLVTALFILLPFTLLCFWNRANCVALQLRSISHYRRVTGSVSGSCYLYASISVLVWERSISISAAYGKMSIAPLSRESNGLHRPSFPPASDPLTSSHRQERFSVWTRLLRSMAHTSGTQECYRFFSEKVN